MIDLTPRKVPGPFGPLDAWPHIVQYRGADGKLHNTPPKGRWRLVVHDRDAYEALAARGAIYGSAHTGRRSKMHDQRRAPGG